MASRAVILVFCVNVLGGCGYDQGDACEVAPNLEALQRAVFKPSCGNFTSCHNDTKSFSELGSTRMSLASAEATCRSLIGVESKRVPGKLRVVAGEPQNSYLMDKLENRIDPVDRMKTPPMGGGRSMPFGNNPDKPTLLCGPKIEAVRQWIATRAAADCAPYLGAMDGGIDAAVDAAAEDASAPDAGAADAETD